MWNTGPSSTGSEEFQDRLSSERKTEPFSCWRPSKDAVADVRVRWWQGWLFLLQERAALPVLVPELENKHVSCQRQVSQGCN